VSAALAKVPSDKKTGKPWNSTPEESEYDPCADLSAVVVTVVDSTRSSPDLALMFHRGVFVGTATPQAYPFTDVEALTTVGFQWQGDRVQMLDPPPESFDSPPTPCRSTSS
jgi:hypothetical protein